MAEPIPHLDSGWLVSDVNRACWRPEGFVHVILGNDEHRDGRVYDESDGLDALAMVSQIAEGQGGDDLNLFVLTDIRGISRTTASVRRLSSHPQTTRLALFVDGPVSRVLGNAYLGIAKLPHATRLFTDEQKAVSWLLEPDVVG